MECLRCEEIISVEEFEMNQGLCDKCYKRFKWLSAIFGDRIAGEMNKAKGK